MRKSRSTFVVKMLIYILLLSVFACCLSSCSARRVDDRLVGKWERVGLESLGSGEIWEFTSAGTLRVGSASEIEVEARNGVITYWPNSYMEMTMWTYEFPKDDNGNSQDIYMILSQTGLASLHLVRIT